MSIQKGWRRYRKEQVNMDLNYIIKKKQVVIKKICIKKDSG